MRIGFLTSDLAHQHGWGHYSLSLLQALQRQGVQPTVWASRNSSTDFPFAVEAVLPTLSPAEKQQFWKLLAFSPRLRQALSQVDLLHIMVEPYAPLGLWQPRPYVLTAHGSYARAGVSRPLGIAQVHRQSFYRARRVICVSHYTEQVVQSHTPNVATLTIPNGVDVERFAQLPVLPNAPARPIVLSTGIKGRKGTLSLLHAIAQVREHIPDVLCVIVGNPNAEPHYAQQVQALLDTLDLRQHVQLAGFVSDEELLGWYGVADVFALPSLNAGWKFEGFGLAHLEASAAGLPVVGTRGCGAEDAILDGESGYLVSQSALETELPRVLIQLLQDAPLRQRMGQAGKAHAQRMTWDRTALAMLQLYQATLHERP